MCSVIKEEFRLRNFGLSYEHPHHFFTPQWRWPFPVFIGYRFIMAAYTIFAFIQAIIFEENFLEEDYEKRLNSTGDAAKLNVMAFLTIWTYIIISCHFILAFIIATASYKTYVKSKTDPHLKAYDNAAFALENGHVKENSNSINFVKTENGENKNGSAPNRHFETSSTAEAKTIPWYSKISWLLANILSDVSIVVSAIYFGGIYKPGHAIPLTDVNIHALNTVFILADNFISARPFRLLHVIYPIMYGVIYNVFYVIYWAVDHRRVVYVGVLDWNNPGFTAGVICAVLVLIIILHLANFGLYRLKIFIFDKCCR